MKALKVQVEQYAMKAIEIPVEVPEIVEIGKNILQF